MTFAVPRQLRAGALPALLAALLCVACGVEEPLARRQQRVIDGAPDTARAAVGMVLCDAEDPADDRFCSGTLIGERVVLTAAHCVVDRASADQRHVPLSPLYFVAGGDAGLDPQSGMLTGGEIFAVDAVRAHPAYAEAPNSDLAVVRLASPVPLGVARPIPLVEALPGADIELRIFGFGVATAGDKSTVGTRRVAVDSWTRVDATTYAFDDSDTPTMCDGDSGGPTLVLVDGAERLSGVHVATIPGCQQGGIDMRVDVYRPWIERKVAALVAGAAEPPEEPLAPAGADYGESCERSSGCRGHLCIEVSRLFGGYDVCSQACARDADCPGGDDCTSNGYCLPPRPEKGDELGPSAEEGGCAVARGPGTAWLLPLLLLWGFARQRGRR